MIAHRDSTTSILEWVVDRVVLNLEYSKNEEFQVTRSLTFSESSNDEVSCRICYDSTRHPIIYPCRCKGTMGSIHLACLERWLEESNRSSCELCGYHFDVERTPRYDVLRSIVVWFCMKQEEHQLFVRSLRMDVIRCVIVTPLTIASSYICIVAADFYSTNNYDNFPPARWTTYSLLAMMVLLIFSYFIWMYMAIQYHQRVWYYWWQKTSIVRLKHHRTLTGDVNKSPSTCHTRMSHGISPV